MSARALQTPTKLNTTENSKILIIYPHPDDETFFSGGFILRNLKLGAKIKVISLTKGEASTLRFGVPENISLADVRAQEFKTAMQKLGVTNYAIEDYPDGKLENCVPKLKKYVEDQIINFAPTHLVTFEPWGAYGHPDHVAVSELITNLAHEHKFNLIYATVNPTFKFSESTLNMAKEPEKVKPHEPNYVLTLTLSELYKKLLAGSAHKSQTGSKQNPLTQLKAIRQLKKEYFLLTYSF